MYPTVFAITVRVTWGGSQSAAATNRFAPSVVVPENAANAAPLSPNTRPVATGTMIQRLGDRFIRDPPAARGAGLVGAAGPP